MKTEKEVKKKEELKNKGEVVHVMKLLNQLSRRLPDCYFEIDERKRVRGFLSSIEEGIKQMDVVDIDLQNQPENKKKNLRAEIIKNDEFLKKNAERHRIQVQRGLIQKGYPQSSPFYDDLIQTIKLDVADLKIKVDGGFKAIHPTFVFQGDPEWEKVQQTIHEKKLIANEKNLAEITKNVEEVERDIVKQNERIKIRRKQIIEELKELKADVFDFDEKPPSYIN